MWAQPLHPIELLAIDLFQILAEWLQSRSSMNHRTWLSNSMGWCRCLLLLPKRKDSFPKCTSNLPECQKGETRVRRRRYPGQLEEDRSKRLLRPLAAGSCWTSRSRFARSRNCRLKLGSIATNQFEHDLWNTSWRPQIARTGGERRRRPTRA
jgi:hypothetical protein